MLEVEKIFKAQAASLWDTMNCHGGSSGFRIPEYQRSYDWSEERIGRLLEDCANGFGQLRRKGEQEPSFTFLGTLILFNEKSESTFDGKSLAVVDGQQRLTTLLLICCALVEKISSNLKTAEDLPPPARELILGEAGRHIGQLCACIVGQLRNFQQTGGRYPRIIRHEDNRASDSNNADYKSTIANFLMDFADHYSGADRAGEEYRFQFSADADGTSKRLGDNYEFIKQEIAYIAGLLQKPTEDKSPDYEVVPSQEFNRKSFTNLLLRIDRGKHGKIVSAIAKEGPSNVLTRLVLFASYISQCVVLTRVEAEDEDSAFDIFDALNTTGEPLTAIETFKPLVMKTEGREYKGASGLEFEEIEKVLRKIKKADARQSEARDLVISFALYASGDKVPKDLRQQRSHLRRSYEKDCKTPESKQRFVRSLAEMTKFRDECWSRDGIRETPSLESDARLCLQVVRDMNTSSVLPIITRYWAAHRSAGDEKELMKAFRALTAFLVLRRSVTGSTGGIDGVFRSMMKEPSGDDRPPLCCGLQSENQLLNVEELKGYLRELIAVKPIGVTGKNTWIQNTKDTPIAGHTSALAKFLILAASHYAIPDPDQPGMLTRKDVRKSEEQEYLTYAKWISPEYKTIEHVAPANPGQGWDPDIYERQRFTRNTVGNLVLLPQKENTSLGNSPWKHKRLFYLALTEPDSAEQERCLHAAEADGLKFPATTRALIQEGKRLPLLDPIREVEKWDESLIRARTENILALAWDTLEPWLWD